MVLHDGASAALDCEDASYFENDVLWTGPAAHRTGQLDSNNLHGITTKTDQLNYGKCVKN